jgi:NAD(P)-dependent dehydrogenase (short-subunit alcohol dehydrogenase family)
MSKARCKEGSAWRARASQKRRSYDRERTFRTNVFSMPFLSSAALPQLGQGSAIVNTTSERVKVTIAPFVAA